jgi:hypothetical protein
MGNFPPIGQSGKWREKMRKADELARLIVFLLLAYFVFTAAGVFAFTFVW